MADQVKGTPEGYHTITPALTCKGAAQAIEFYKKAFGATEIMRMEGPGGSIGHAEMQIGNSRFFLNDEFPGMASAPDVNAKAASSYLFIYSENVNKDFDTAVSAGCDVTMPLMDQFWGDRFGRLKDPYGHHWGMAQHVEDVAPEEMERRSKEWQAQMAKAAGQN
jgi:PhnB protein